MLQEKSMTALVSAFSRAYHNRVNTVRIFGDPLASKLLSEQEFEEISGNMAKGIGFFNPGFHGSADEALRWVCDNMLSPTPLGRACFIEAALKNAAEIGAEQYLILASGLDTFPYRQPLWAEPLEIFELDLPRMTADKQERLERAEIAVPENLHFLSADLCEEGWERVLKKDEVFDRESITFCSMAGLTNYLSEAQLKTMLTTLFGLLPEGSAVAFDYPREEKADGSDKRAALAKAAGEEMKARYTEEKMEHLLSECGLLLYEHLSPSEIQDKYFARYNYANPDHKMNAPKDTAYCLAVKKEL